MSLKHIINTLCYSIFVFKQKTAYEVRISDWSSDVCSSDLHVREAGDQNAEIGRRPARPFVGEKRAVGAADVDLAQCPGHRVEPGREGYRVEFELSLRGAQAARRDLLDRCATGVDERDVGPVVGLVIARIETQPLRPDRMILRSEEHTSELQSLMRISYAVFCLKK